MNPSFFNLPQEKRDNLTNAAFQVFSRWEYHKAPMSEIARAGGISKALLFYYFRNKQELYLYLWDLAVEETRRKMRAFRATETEDFFEMLTRSLLAKCQLVRECPWLYLFSVRAYYEPDPELQRLISARFASLSEESEGVVWAKISREDFRPGIDLQLMYQEMLWASDGYLRQMVSSGALDADRMEQDFLRLIAQWKQVYLR